MKKTININIRGVGFTIDDDAFRMLDNYLETLSHALKNSPDGSEIMEDIETRVAELLCERDGGSEAIVTLTDVETVIARIGRADEIDEIEVEVPGAEEKVEVDDNAGATPPPPPVVMQETRKRLFRDPQRGMLGGVCAGLAAYLNIDVTWVRLLVIAIIFVSFSTVGIIYVILWIVLPVADTPLKQMEMRGETVTLANVGRKVTDTFTKVGDEINYVANNVNAKSVAAGLTHIFATIGKTILMIVAIVFVPVLVAMTIGFVACLVCLIMSLTDYVYDFSSNQYIFDASELLLPSLCGIGWIIVVGVPMMMFVLLILSSGKHHLPKSNSGRTALASIWVLAIVLASVSMMLMEDFSEVKIIRGNENEATKNVKLVEKEVVVDTMEIKPGVNILDNLEKTDSIK